jgi:hypothetical protein
VACGSDGHCPPLAIEGAGYVVAGQEIAHRWKGEKDTGKEHNAVEEIDRLGCGGARETVRSS